MAGKATTEDGSPVVKKVGKKIKRKSVAEIAVDDCTFRSESPSTAASSSKIPRAKSSSRNSGAETRKKKKVPVIPHSPGDVKKKVAGLENSSIQSAQLATSSKKVMKKLPATGTSLTSASSTVAASSKTRPTRSQPIQRSVQRSKSSDDAAPTIDLGVIKKERALIASNTSKSTDVTQPSKSVRRTSGTHCSSPISKKKAVSISSATLVATNNTNEVAPRIKILPDGTTKVSVPAKCRGLQRAASSASVLLHSTTTKTSASRSLSPIAVPSSPGSPPSNISSESANRKRRMMIRATSNPVLMDRGQRTASRPAPTQRGIHKSVSFDESRIPDNLKGPASPGGRRRLRGSLSGVEASSSPVTVPGSISSKAASPTTTQRSLSMCVDKDSTAPLAPPLDTGGKKRPAPLKRGVQRHASAPTSYKPKSIRDGRHAGLQSISEVKVMKKPGSKKKTPTGAGEGINSVSPLPPTTMPVPPSPTREARGIRSQEPRTMHQGDRATSMRQLTQYKGNCEDGDSMKLTSPDFSVEKRGTNSVPDLQLDRPHRLHTGQGKNTGDEYGSDSNPQNGRNGVSRTRSDDLSSFARSHHEPSRGLQRSCSSGFRKEPQKVLLPGQQQGILRNSTHQTRSQTINPAPRRGEVDVEQGHPILSAAAKPPSSWSHPVAVAFTDLEDGYISGDESSSVEEISISFDPKPRATPRPSLQRGFSVGSLNFSSHSLKSTRSQLSIDKEPFEDDSAWKNVLRYLHLLPPHKNEKPLKRRIRVFTWLVLFFDFIVALVAISTYDGATKCCGVPIYSMIAKINWDTCVRAVIYLYFFAILAEIIPVVRQGLPFNLLNPTLGFAITIAMFFDDSVAQAVAMWILEALAVFFEFLVYRVKVRLYREESARLLKTDEDLANLKKSQKNILAASMNGGFQNLGSKRSMTISRTNSFDEDDSLSGRSFGDNDSNRSLDDGCDYEDPTRNTASKSGSYSLPSGRAQTSIDRSVTSSDRKSTRTMESPVLTTLRRSTSDDELGPSCHSMASSCSRVPLPWERKQMRLLRERRILRQKQKLEKSELRFHLIGSCINIGFIVISLILIIAIASTGGLCVYNGTIKIFHMDQLGKCNQCIGTADVCEVCNSDDNQQCYYPYY